MSTLLIAVGSFVAFIVAYHTYGRWLARTVFDLDPNAPVPSRQLRDDVDFVPTRKQVIFGHHFTSIAGTGPIVGPAIAAFWGWLPALIFTATRPTTPMNRRTRAASWVAGCGLGLPSMRSFT